MWNTRKQVKVIICNNYTLYREGIKSVFQQDGSIKVVGEANTANEAIEQLARLRPDAVLMDMTTPDLSGSEATRRIKLIDPNVKVLVLSLHDDEILTSLCMEAGADGCIPGDRSAWYLQNAIHAACQTDQRVRGGAVGLPSALEGTAADPMRSRASRVARAG